MKLLLPWMGWGRIGQSQEGDQQHPGSRKRPLVAGQRATLEGGGKAKQHKGHRRLLVHSLSLLTPSCSYQADPAWLVSGEETLETRAEAGPRVVSCSPILSRRIRFEPCDHQGLGPRQAE